MTIEPTSAVNDLLRRLDDDRIVERIWARDYTVWRPEPTEISNRLGWLDLPETMREHVPRLLGLADEIASDTDHVVVVGMGGSSLGAEALRGAFGERPGAPRLVVADSTVPSWVHAILSEIDPARTIFVIASKSGGTAEVMALFDAFWAATESAVQPAGSRFVAITDPGTSLERLAGERGFRDCFVNPPDIGGRFSVLSLFGLVPAALAGIDVEDLLDRAAEAATTCGPDRAARDNPAARLAAFLAVSASAGRPLATIQATTRLAGVGLWAEQLVAESTGKEGTGVLPVTGEAPEDAVRGPGRSWVRLLLHGDPAVGAEPPDADWTLERRLRDPLDLGSELFVWELATAVLGHLQNVHPFDQPDVQSAKDRTNDALAAFERDGRLEAPAAGDDLAQAITAPDVRYVALLGYLSPDVATAGSVARLRRVITSRFELATTFGYGPRYLHSTGQLHKGGFDGGLFVQLVEAGEELPIPGREYGFEVLARAQANGDLAALRDADRATVRVELGRDPAREIDGLASRLATTS